MPRRYWLIHPNGGRQMIDPRRFDLDEVSEQARRIGGRLVVEGEEADAAVSVPVSPAGATPTPTFEPPVSALASFFRARLDQIFLCECDFQTDVNIRPTVRMLGGYYRRRRLVRVYAIDRVLGRRPLEELFDTFLHEVAHHIEYTEPHSFHAKESGRVRGRMHSHLFWSILGELKGRWIELQRFGRVSAIVDPHQP